jgi:hypothetical protein
MEWDYRSLKAFRLPCTGKLSQIPVRAIQFSLALLCYISSTCSGSFPHWLSEICDVSMNCLQLSYGFRWSITWSWMINTLPTIPVINIVVNWEEIDILALLRYNAAYSGQFLLIISRCNKKMSSCIRRSCTSRNKTQFNSNYNALSYISCTSVHAKYTKIGKVRMT